MTDRPLGEQIGRLLVAHSVGTVFGIPGVHNIELYRGLESSGLTHVLARHEQGAGFMADGYARATGKPGVAFVITGPGLTNIMTPMGQAYSDSVPLLVISSCLDETAAQQGQLHQMRDQRAAAATVCDWSEEARTPKAAYGLIDRAFTEFLDDETASRPKHIQIPIAVLGAPAEPPGPKPVSVWPARVGTSAGVSDQIAKAERPLFILGGGLVRAGERFWPDDIKAKASSSADIVALALDRCGAASFTTYAGRGLVPPTRPLYLGSYLARPESAAMIASADLVVAVGTRLSEVDLWRNHLGHKATLIRVDTDADVLAERHPDQFALRQDAVTFMAALAREIAQSQKTNWSPEEVSGFRQRMRAQVDAERPGIVPVCDALREALPENAMVFSDMTQFAYAAKEVWDMGKPGLWHHPYGFGTLGYALPAAIGAKAGMRDDPVVAIAGDYGFQYTVQELGTAAELGLPLPILLWDNGMLKEIEAAMTSAQIAPVAVKALNPDFGGLAKAYGLGYVRPADLADLQDAVTGALTAAGPVLIHMTPGMSEG